MIRLAIGLAVAALGLVALVVVAVAWLAIRLDRREAEER